MVRGKIHNSGPHGPSATTHAIESCDPDSESKLTGFYGTLTSQKRDTLFIDDNVFVDPTSMRLVAGCAVRRPTLDDKGVETVALAMMRPLLL